MQSSRPGGAGSLGSPWGAIPGPQKTYTRAARLLRLVPVPPTSPLLWKLSSCLPEWSWAQAKGKVMGKILKALGTAVGGKGPGQAQEVEASPGAGVKLLLCKSCVCAHV